MNTLILVSSSTTNLMMIDMVTAIVLILLVLTLYIILIFRTSRHNNRVVVVGDGGGDEIYLVEFSCYKPPTMLRVPHSRFVEHSSISGIFSRESVDLMEKVSNSSGFGDETYLPPSLHMIPPSNSMKESIEEVRMVLFPVMETLLRKAKLRSQDIDILFVNCSGFCPSPSLASIVINGFKMRDDVKSFNLSGMGCGAGIIAVDTVSKMLKVHKNHNAVILSTEILSTGWYHGKEQSKLLLNCGFRMGAAAILLTNRKEARKTSKYKLVHSRRTLTSFNDNSYTGAFLDEDSEGITGASINNTVFDAAAETLRLSIRDLAIQILPLSEKLKYSAKLIFDNILRRLVTSMSILFNLNNNNKLINKKKDLYVPNFKTVINHFCLPTPGRKIIRELGKTLRLEEKDMEPVLSTLHRFGNQASSTWWYQLAYLEAKRRIKRGDKVWQLGFGSGLKCSNVVWESLFNHYSRSHHIINDDDQITDNQGPWDDCINAYPINRKASLDTAIYI